MKWSSNPENKQKMKTDKIMRWTLDIGGLNLAKDKIEFEIL